MDGEVRVAGLCVHVCAPVYDKQGVCVWGRKLNMSVQGPGGDHACAWLLMSLFTGHVLCVRRCVSL